MAATSGTATLLVTDPRQQIGMTIRKIGHGNHLQAQAARTIGQVSGARRGGCSLPSLKRLVPPSAPFGQRLARKWAIALRTSPDEERSRAGRPGLTRSPVDCRPW